MCVGGVNYANRTETLCIVFVRLHKFVSFLVNAACRRFFLQPMGPLCRRLCGETYVGRIAVFGARRIRSYKGRRRLAMGREGVA